MTGYKKAFTLAEVLITIAIIGVVAAMLIPNLVQGHQSRAWDTASKMFETKLTEALKVMNTQGVLGIHSTTEEFAQELSRHLGITKICNNNDLKSCFPERIKGVNAVIDVADSSTWSNDGTPIVYETSKIKTAKDLGQKWNSNVVGIQLKNGQSALLAYNNQNCEENPYSNQITGLDCVAVVYDVTGYETPNAKNKDLRTLNASIGGEDCVFKIEGQCVVKGLFKPEPVSFDTCIQMRDEGGYGITACESNPDHWAGAVKECGGTNKMPSLAQIAKIASYIYDADIGPDTSISSGLSFKHDRLTAIGFSSVWEVWANQQDQTYAGTHAYIRLFNNGSTYVAGEYRHGANTNTKTICFK